MYGLKGRTDLELVGELGVGAEEHQPEAVNVVSGAHIEAQQQARSSVESVTR
jgi:hypothetical protein